jgi:phosphate-selective porin OprO/OprP
MKHPRMLVMVLTVNSLLGADVAIAAVDERKFRAMERRIQELERRLEVAEQHNRTIQATPSAEVSPAAKEQTVKSLDQKVRTLERKLEVEQEVASENAKKIPKIEAGPSGVKISSPDGGHNLRIRGFVQADGNFFMDDSTQGTTPQDRTNIPDKFTLRRARLLLDGTLFKYVDFRFAPDFGGGQARIFDGYVDLHYFPFASLAAGKQKAPISLERLQSATALLFAERAYPTQLAPNRDLGVVLHGDIPRPGYSTRYAGLHNFNEFITYHLGVFNGTTDNQAVQNADTDRDDDKEFEGRVFAHPFQHSGVSALEGLGIGIAGSWGQPFENQLANLTSPGQNPVLSYTNATSANTVRGANVITNASTVTSSGDHYRIYPQAYWYWGPYGLLGEWVLSSQGVHGVRTRRVGTATNLRNDVSIRQNNTAWQIAASYVLTGEDNTFQGVRPIHPFDPFAGTWGAFQLAARWSELDIDGDTFRNFGTAQSPFFLANPQNSVSRATSWAVGLNWYLNANIKLMADYEQTYFEGGKSGTRSRIADRETEKVFFTRFQYAF